MDEEASRISETVSENKRKRGRPSVWPLLYGKNVGVVMKIAEHGGITTKRGRLNNLYLLQGVQLLKNRPELEWLHHPKKPGEVRHGILTELGRIMLYAGEETALAVARQLCELKPATTRRAVEMIRRARLGEREGDTTDLANAIINAINAYKLNHEATTQEQTISALFAVMDAITTPGPSPEENDAHKGP